MKPNIVDINQPLDSLTTEELSPDTYYIIPSNYGSATDESEYYYPSTLTSFIKLAKENKLDIEILGNKDNQNLLEQRSGEWVVPVLVVSGMLVTQQPTLVAIALGMISSYLVKLFSGTKDNNVKFKILVTDKKGVSRKEVTYEGPVEGIKEINGAIETAAKNITEG